MSRKGKFKIKIEEALKDPVLQKSLNKFGEEFPAKRQAAYGDIDFEELRKKISEIKSKAAQNITQYAKRFEEKLSARGANVHRAKDGRDVVAILKEIIDRRGAKVCVKSKSMASEEIYLNDKLGKIIKVVETDLGEWLIQQINHKPSHMIQPAIHLSKEQCADIFSNYLGKKIEPDISSMVKQARKILREEFLKADIGISGCNIAVADSGTVCIFTNEGNGRLTSTLPPVHVIIVGYEKFVETIQEAALIAKALPKSATGQLMTSYITMISAPTQTFLKEEEAAIGKKELHIILLDNGRLNYLTDETFRELGQCIRCGSCINVCPIYIMLSGHVFGSIYPGGIGSMLTYFLNSPEDSEQIQELCISCGRCKEFCPGKIDIPALLLETRRRIREKLPLPFPVNFALEQILPRKKILDLSMRSASLIDKAAASNGKDGHKYIRRLPLWLKKYSSNRSLPAFAKKPFRDIFKNIKQNIEGKTRGKIALFGGCLIDYIYPEIAEAVIYVLNKFGYIVDYPEQSCCGAPAIYMGKTKAAASSAKSHLKEFASSEYEYIITACPTCTHTIKKHWVDWLQNSSKELETAKIAADKTLDFIELFYRLTHNERSAIVDISEIQRNKGNGASDKISVTYHDSCHLLRNSGLKKEPRLALQQSGEIDLIEMNESDKCCGFGGSYSAKFPEVSMKLLERKIENIQASRSEIIACDCPGCLLNIRGSLDARNMSQKAMHTAEILKRVLLKKK